MSIIISIHKLRGYNYFCSSRIIVLQLAHRLFLVAIYFFLFSNLPMSCSSPWMSASPMFSEPQSSEVAAELSVPCPTPGPRCLFSVAPSHPVPGSLNEEKPFECPDLCLITEIPLALTLPALSSLLLLTAFTDAFGSSSHPSPAPGSVFPEIQFPFTAFGTSVQGMLPETTPAGLTPHLSQLRVSGRLREHL